MRYIIIIGFIILMMLLAGFCIAQEKFSINPAMKDAKFIVEDDGVLRLMRESYGTNAPAAKLTASQQVKQLARDGEICKVFGCTFGTDWGAVVTWSNQAYICKFCKARKVTKTVTEIIPAKEAK